MRPALVWLHRWLGLTMAGFLVVVSVTGSILVFHDEINHALAPEVWPGREASKPLGFAALARRAEALVPGARVSTIYLGRLGVAQIGVEAEPGDEPLAFDKLYLDPETGEERARFYWGAVPTSTAGVLPFVYNLHYMLAAGETGAYALGVVALLWAADSFIALGLTLPRLSPRSQKSFLQRWKPAFLIKLRASNFRLVLDLHRASGLWLWGMFLVFALSGVYFNLNGVYTAAMRLVTDFDPPYWATPHPEPAEADTPISWEAAQSTAEQLMAEKAVEHGFAVVRPLSLYIDRGSGAYEYRVRSTRDIGVRAGITSLLFDAHTGRFRSLVVPTGQRAGETFTTWLTELHTANLFGLPYRLFVFISGLAVTALSVTGVYVWWRKRRSRTGLS
jgi:uncharacterized iron-regulated membrane protein